MALSCTKVPTIRQRVTVGAIAQPGSGFLVACQGVVSNAASNCDATPENTASGSNIMPQVRSNTVGIFSLLRPPKVNKAL